MSFAAKSVLKSLVAYPLIVVGSNLLLLVLYASTCPFVIPVVITSFKPPTDLAANAVSKSL